MNINTSALSYILNMTKDFKNKNQTIDLEIKNERFIVRIKDDTNILRLSNLQVEEKDKERVTIEKSFLQKIERQKGEDIKLRFNEKTLSAKIGSLNFRTNLLEENLSVFNKEIELTEERQNNWLLITSEILTNINQAVKYISTDNKRPILRGVNLKTDGSKLYIAATDSYKMLYKMIEIEEPKGSFNVTISPENIAVLNTIMEANNGRPYPLYITEQNLLINNAAIYYIGTILSGTYPNIEGAIKNVTKDEPIDTIRFTEEEINNLKAIKDRRQFLMEIESNYNDQKTSFSTKSEINKNTFEINREVKENYSKLGNIDHILLALEDAKIMKILDLAFEFEYENGIILVLGVRQ